MTKPLKLILIQDATVATYIRRQQVAIVHTGEPPDAEIVSEIFNSPEFWEKAIPEGIK